MAITFVGGSYALPNGTQASLSVPKPSGVQAGDILILEAIIGTTVTYPSASDFTLISSNRDIYASSKLFYRVATASEPTSYSVSTGGYYAGAILVAYRGVDNAAPIDAYGGYATSDTSVTVTAGSLTTTKPDCMIVAVACVGWGSSQMTFTPPSGMTERVDATHPSGASGFSATAADAIQALVGGSGTKAFTRSITEVLDEHGYVVALPPSVSLKIGWGLVMA